MVNIQLYKKRFLGFWNQFKKSKKGVVGIALIIFFGFIALFAPVIAPIDPMRPTWPGKYPGGQPKIAEITCVPIWYKTILGMENLSENMEVVPGHEFNSREDFEQWNISTNSDYLKVEYDQTMGENGSIKISYCRPANATTQGLAEVTLIKSFSYPFGNPPKSFWIHYSVYETSESGDGEDVSLTFFIEREDEPFKLFSCEHFHADEWDDSIASSTSYDVQSNVGSLEPQRTIFTKQTEYKFKIVVTIKDENADEEKEERIYLDNLQMILYGEAYGLLGTDADRSTPRDLFAMLIHGTRISFMVGFLAAVFSVLIGLAAGLVSGFVGGLIDEAIMRIADLLLVLPTLPLMIALVMVLGRSIWNVIGVLIFLGWMGFSRSIRSMVLSIRERPFIEAAKAAGGTTSYIIWRHVLPNVFPLVYITLATSVPGAIIAEASLAWLGLGDINVPSWGTMFYNYQRTASGATAAFTQWYWVIPPGIAITLMAMAFIMIGFSLDEILNPRLRERQ